MIAALLLTAATAAAAPAATPAFDVSADLALVSDYRFRGASLSAGRPAVQAGISVVHRSGAFAEAWTSTLPRRLGSAELDLGAGWSGTAGGTELTVGARAYLYPSLTNADYAEFHAAAARTFSGVALSAAAAYAPDQPNLARDDLYLSADARVSLRAETLTLVAHAGWERGPFNLTRTKWDWSAGLALAHGPLTLAATYADTDQPAARDTGDAFGATLLASVSLSF